jgi:hypothetical protein
MSRPQAKLLIFFITDGGAFVILGDRGMATPKVGAGGEMVFRKSFRIFMHFRKVLYMMI